MAGQIRMDVKGIEPIIRRFKDKRNVIGPVNEFYKDSTKVMRRNVQQEISVRTGRGRRSVRRSGISKRKVTRAVKIFTRRFHLRFQEYGTQRGLSAQRWFLKGLQASQPDIRRNLVKLEHNLVRALKQDV